MNTASRTQPIQAASAEQLAQLERHLPASARWPVSRWRNMLAGDVWHARCVMIDGEVVAVAVADIAQRPAGPIAMILTLNVAPKWQDVGIGSLLLKEMTDLASEQDLTISAQLPVGADDGIVQPARIEQFYERAGFRQEGQIVENFYSSGRGAAVYVLA